MASDAADDFDKSIENLKGSVRTSFARIYASLKARELITLRQLEAIRKHCQDDKDLKKSCIRDLNLSFDNETTLLDNIYNYGAIELEKLKFDSSTFSLEDYVSPENDHMYSHKTIEDLAKLDEETLAIEEAALKQVTANENCVCLVNIRTEDVSKQFRDSPPASPMKVCSDCTSTNKETDSGEIEDLCKQKESPEKEDEKSLNDSDPEIKKIEPTDEWLNTIKNQTETEPTQMTDVMEHSTITCS